MVNGYLQVAIAQGKPHVVEPGRILCAEIGRPCAVIIEQFDIDFGRIMAFCNDFCD
jgi:hypothetical protein